MFADVFRDKRLCFVVLVSLFILLIYQFWNTFWQKPRLEIHILLQVGRVETTQNNHRKQENSPSEKKPLLEGDSNDARLHPGRKTSTPEECSVRACILRTETFIQIYQALLCLAEYQTQVCTASMTEVPPLCWLTSLNHTTITIWREKQQNKGIKNIDRHS